MNMENENESKKYKNKTPVGMHVIFLKIIDIVLILRWDTGNDNYFTSRYNLYTPLLYTETQLFY